jgi:hypothetical protein
VRLSTEFQLGWIQRVGSSCGRENVADALAGVGIAFDRVALPLSKISRTTVLFQVGTADVSSARGRIPIGTGER